MTHATTRAGKIHETPPPKIPAHPFTTTTAPCKEEKIDRQVEASFPASDPPSYSGGGHAVGAPENRESGAATADADEVVQAEKKVKDGTAAKDPHKY